MRFLTKLAIALVGWNFLPPADAPAASQRHHSEQRQTIVLYEGVVDGKSAERFLDLISKSEDKIIGLKIEADTIETPRYSVIVDGDQLVITAGDPLDAPQELVVNGPTGRSLAYHLIDGFYLIKFGGSHAAGALSWGALPVDEAKIRLDPKLRIVRKPF
jgi:hypothetical protein